MFASGLLLVTCLLLHAAADGASLDDATLDAASPKEATRGPVTARVELEPQQPRFGDPLTLTLTVTAEPGVEVIMPEFEDGLERYSISSFSKREQLDDQGRTVLAQEYLLLAPRSGEHSIPPLMVEFVDRRAGQEPAPEGDDAYELLTPRLDFDIASVVPDTSSAELRQPMGRVEDPILEETARLWPWIFGGVLLLVVVPLLANLIRVLRKRARRRSAYDVAMTRLRRLTGAARPDGEAWGPYFVELSALVRQYLEDRFDLRAPELTTEEFLDVVSRSPDVSREHQQLLQGFLRQADLVKFAHSIPAKSVVDESLKSAEQFLSETRENAPLLEEEDVAQRIALPSKVEGS